MFRANRATTACSSAILVGFISDIAHLFRAVVTWLSTWASSSWYSHSALVIIYILLHTLRVTRIHLTKGL